MNYTVYKLEFTTGVHFGRGMLNDSDYVFQADILFSAMYIEALKCGKAEELYDSVRTGKLLFSDALPFNGDSYMIPKPLLRIERGNRGDSEEKKKFKKLRYLPVDCLDEFISGNMDLEEDPMKDFGRFHQRVMASVRREGDTLPYHVGMFYFRPGNGLYVIIAYESGKEKNLAEELLEAVSYSGIGGEKSRGLGRFELKTPGKRKETLIRRLQKESSDKMLLSIALPREEEMDAALTGASYLLGKRSGFVWSDNYADELRKKADLYVFTAGSCFRNSFEGDIFDVSREGKHPVYRYAKPLFMGV
ncbi:MAG: type III-A CRISPR-associated RAMP protein Csm4 [Dorea sp.]|nr:type III-A CRISPR-associated RAMP protein Csm4 [Dorea sp.]